MATDVLILGPVVFDDWSTPERIPQGGRHTLAVHKLVGGRRVVHAMGPDPLDITWSGKLWGGSAEGVALTLNALKDAGAPLSLLMMGNSYTVVISEFRWEPVRYPQYLEYSITCVVADGYGLSSAASPIAAIGNLVSIDLGAATSVLSDAADAVSSVLPAVSGVLGGVADLAATVGDVVSSVASAVDLVSTAIDAVPLLDAMAATVSIPIVSEVVSAIDLIDSSVSTVSSAVDALDFADAMPDVIAAGITTVAMATDAVLALSEARGAIGRVAANITQVAA